MEATRVHFKTVIVNAGTVMQTCSRRSVGRFAQRFADLGFDATERRIEGEDNLLLIHGESSAGVVSFGIRNSGTQAKTSLSLRLSPGIESAPFASLLEETKGTLANALQ